MVLQKKKNVKIVHNSVNIVQHFLKSFALKTIRTYCPQKFTIAMTIVTQKK